MKRRVSFAIKKDRLEIRQLEEHLAKIPMLEQAVGVNTPGNAM